MVYIDNTQTKKEIEDAIRGNSVSNLAPTKVSDTVQLVLPINPKDYRRVNIVKTGLATNATSATIYTTPTDKDFFLTSLALSIIKDVTSTSLRTDIAVVIDGAAQNLLSICSLTLTAQAQNIAQSYHAPIKIDRGTNITVSNTTNVANITARANLTGYTVEP